MEHNELNDYQERASLTAKYEKRTGVLYTTLGLASEAGEVASKVKKVIRDENAVLSDERRRELALELGDVLWYVAMLSRELGYDLSTVATMNIDKLSDRDTRGVIGGSGDTR